MREVAFTWRTVSQCPRQLQILTRLSQTAQFRLITLSRKTRKTTSPWSEWSHNLLQSRLRTLAVLSRTLNLIIKFQTVIPLYPIKKLTLGALSPVMAQSTLGRNKNTDKTLQRVQTAMSLVRWSARPRYWTDTSPSTRMALGLTIAQRRFSVPTSLNKCNLRVKKINLCESSHTNY